MTLLIAESHGLVIKGFHQGFGFPKNQSKNCASKSKKSLGCHLHVVMLIKVSIPSSQACIHKKKSKGKREKIKDSPQIQNPKSESICDS